ncbi:hypothetical protein BAUCODRAFT_121925 [Baudoinia panamericana UAMH 10762]|uniref:Uncharacterized protein n=1 Tax=Baudoinia panamericana (strain UAMH 10762) TaxID=717646 RepID=M2MLE2_BAUPA|nr:uncharacterized protein BAUCODRAFT_121925 [Baudoinia panamericana UAMH 10762]EMC97481.1 hypothetical protein BAUCODRAFT_121925 [Baudoinia panamericana UAMH 10762]
MRSLRPRGFHQHTLPSCGTTQMCAAATVSLRVVQLVIALARDDLRLSRYDLHRSLDTLAALSEEDNVYARLRSLRWYHNAMTSTLPTPFLRCICSRSPAASHPA